MSNRTHLIDTSESAGRSSSTQAGTPAVLAALRDATAERHELLHEIMPLSVDSVALRDYVAHLTILRDWLVPLDAWLEAFDDGPQSPSRPPQLDRLALIRADLAHPSVDPHMLAGMTLQREARGWSGARSAAYRWGVCYVIEGSQLGGAVLYARLKERLAPHPLGYLDAGRDTLSPRWKAWIHALAADVHTPVTIDEACRGAAEAFDRLIELAQRPAGADCASVV
jgi:heme oxygenase (biliverdin-IX-beta and delta-forming)